ncbi:hypothetical protein KDK95_25930 [Actinospica sp. MGRD01-02]|uniref:Uncharacterized protein n=1 Tax=Actinospica acidithermotolerans TaxID=2828514 RepID=A0A941EE07_9ACTN|nr:hypothetical protein [Actinospica acidithermotolerans]MBR7829771.1 hypothetical protein [Actinospica acidithermotolerans]
MIGLEKRAVIELQSVRARAGLEKRAVTGLEKRAVTGLEQRAGSGQENVR